MKGTTQSGTTARPTFDQLFRQRSHGFLSKMGAWECCAGRSIQDLAADLVVWFGRFPDATKLLFRLNDHHADSFTHCANVCLLAAMQAAHRGLSHDDVREVALAGLLHDVGKIAVPTDVLDKEAPLTRQEAARISVHSVAGARVLAGVSGLPGLVLVGAWEHHLHHDGKGGYPRPSRNRVPHGVSQMIALADFFDALTTPKPYRTAQPLDLVLQMMREREGRIFRPDLLHSFFEVIDAVS